MSPWWVVCLCAGWCRSCEDYRPIFDAVRLQHPQMRFVWVDIEDESELVGELDIETFPTLLVADASGPRFFAPMAPYAEVLARMLASLQAQSGRSASLDDGVSALMERIQHAHGSKAM